MYSLAKDCQGSKIFKIEPALPSYDK